MAMQTEFFSASKGRINARIVRFSRLAGPVLVHRASLSVGNRLQLPQKRHFFPAARPPSQAVCSSPALTGPDFSHFTAPLKFTVFSARYRSCITFSSRSTPSQWLVPPRGTPSHGANPLRTPRGTISSVSGSTRLVRPGHCHRGPPEAKGLSAS